MEEVKYEIKLMVGDVVIEAEHTMSIDCSKTCLRGEMIKSSLQKFYADARADLLKELE